MNSNNLKIVNPVWFVELPKYLQMYGTASEKNPIKLHS